MHASFDPRVCAMKRDYAAAGDDSRWMKRIHMRSASERGLMRVKPRAAAGG